MPTSQEIYKVITPNNKKTSIILIALFFVIIIIASLFFFLARNNNEIHYETINPVIGDITQTISATGTLSPTNEVEVGSQISGNIYKLYVEVNDVVKKGQILAEINPNKLNQTLAGYQAQLQSALANLDSSKVTLEQKKWIYAQQKKLYEATNGRLPSQLDLQTAKMEYLSSQADVKIKQASVNQIQTSLQASKIDLQNSIIRSPIDGIILERSISLGQTVAANFQTPTLFKLAENLKEMNLVVNISESDIGKVKTGQDVSFSVDAYPNQEFHAKVDRVNFASTTTDNITSYETKIYVDNENLLLKPGMNATASIKVASNKDAMLVPIAAIFYTPEQNQPKATQKKNSNPLMVRSAMRPKKEKMINKTTQGYTQGEVWVLENNEPKAISVVIRISDSKMVAIQSSELTTNTQVIIDSKY
ncbi:efflux RND transporter periplasmic adaptor subunit [Helicobacter didelphidarum]|uniref:Efflux RND transporter periplasmic adaptor subunit n=1 Tax=Helicobacter didelphidarum TaxID=2040648 RepID=A0A3D8IG16_9HELI|nr:efflux RND transporter periplasmic adaptor subunit [Helicobacter didelphidarum]RDU64063.1 efflux RND transporter periplasmic adaptor subunit [Helicobacter didelphidarum]